MPTVKHSPCFAEPGYTLFRNSVDPDQMASPEVICSGITLFSMQPYTCNPLQWRSQNAIKVTHIKGRLLDQAVDLFNCAPLHNGNLF